MVFIVVVEAKTYLIPASFVDVIEGSFSENFYAAYRGSLMDAAGYYPGDYESIYRAGDSPGYCFGY